MGDMRAGCAGGCREVCLRNVGVLSLVDDFEGEEEA